MTTYDAIGRTYRTTRRPDPRIADVITAPVADAADLESGEWDVRHADLLSRNELDVGYRLVIADL